MAVGGIGAGGSGAGPLPPSLAKAVANLKTGDVITGRVQQTLANGVRLAIGRAVLDVTTQLSLKPGTPVTLQVQRSDGGVTLKLVPPETQSGRTPRGQVTQTQTSQAQVSQTPASQTPASQTPASQTHVSQAQGSQIQASGTTKQTLQPQGQITNAPAAQGTAVSRAQAPAPAPGQQPPTTLTRTGQPNPPQAAPAPQAASAGPTASNQPVPAQARVASQHNASQPQANTQGVAPTTAPTAPAGRGATPVAASQTQVQGPTPQPGANAPVSGSVNVAGTTRSATPQSGSTGNATSPVPPATTLSGRPAGPVAGSAGGPSSAASTPTPGPAAPVSARASTPAEAVQGARSQAATIQTGLAPLFANLSAVLAQPDKGRLDRNVETAARQLLGLRLPAADAGDATKLQKALQSSGLFKESLLARGLPPAEGDLKAALLSLRSILREVLDPAATRLPAGNARSQPPPERDGNPQAQRPSASTLPSNADTQTVLRQLAGDTEGALARMRLLQMASLPDADGIPRQESSEQSQRVWQAELPLGDGRETRTLGIRIERDGRGRKGDQEAPVWRVRLALELEDAGPVSVAIAYSTPQISVGLWAERPETSAALSAGTPVLGEMLQAADLDVESIEVQTGNAPPGQRKGQAGGFLDRRG